jgi:hypothetical protein
MLDAAASLGIYGLFFLLDGILPFSFQMSLQEQVSVSFFGRS